MAGGQGEGTVGKTLEVLDRVKAFGRPVRFSDLLVKSAFPKPTLYRLLKTLTSQIMRAYDPDLQTYAPPLRLVRLAHAAWAQSTLATIARPHIDTLAGSVRETVHLAQMDHAQVLCVDKRNPGQPVQMYSQAGKVGPACCTGPGKVMLAFADPALIDGLTGQQSFHAFTPQTLTCATALRHDLAAIRADGHGFDREEHAPGIICDALPILTAAGRVLGAQSVTCTTRRTNRNRLEGLVASLRTTAQAIARDATDWSFPDSATPPITGN